MNDIEKKAEACLPSPANFFTASALARILGISKRHVLNLIEGGDIEAGIDIRGKGSRKAYLVVPRCSVVKFLSRRMNP